LTIVDFGFRISDFGFQNADFQIFDGGMKTDASSGDAWFYRLIMRRGMDRLREGK
jgi:hypothetical protein